MNNQLTTFGERLIFLKKHYCENCEFKGKATYCAMGINMLTKRNYCKYRQLINNEKA